MLVSEIEILAVLLPLAALMAKRCEKFAAKCHRVSTL